MCGTARPHRAALVPGAEKPDRQLVQAKPTHDKEDQHALTNTIRAFAMKFKIDIREIAVIVFGDERRHS